MFSEGKRIDVIIASCNYRAFIQMQAARLQLAGEGGTGEQGTREAQTGRYFGFDQ
jgi:hypothetical protein